MSRAVFTQPVSVVAFTRVMRGGKHRCIRSHCMTFDATPCHPVCLLPRPLHEDSAYRVVIAGETTDLQDAKTRTMHQIRQDIVKRSLKLYKEKLIFSAKIVVDEDVLKSDDGKWSQASENIVIVADELDEGNADSFSKDVNGEWYGKTFPHLFPFGRGHPGDERKYHISHKECIKHYRLLRRENVFADIFTMPPIAKSFLKDSMSWSTQGIETRFHRCKPFFKRVKYGEVQQSVDIIGSKHLRIKRDTGNQPYLLL
ncbi:hypothetical protein PHMEG_00016074 [Phytophthora megakarya]|uniref:Helitron helicase n=1 Tax=Phytophthora megakarya TaxID=4795 RepID=A0A225VZV6_9STRA|nr:hypothetical protein PHMEG_00016074 [Phytophthora megakarya]